MIIRIVALLCLLVNQSLAQNLEQFISHPVESNFVASANGKYTAWVINDHGRHNIMLRNGTDSPKLFTANREDDGQEISQLVFSPNGTKLVFVYGKGTERYLYVKDVTSRNPPAKITLGHNPVFYPDGLGILFSKGNQIYETSLDINATPKLLFIASGENSNPVFSPNGNDVSFISNRNDNRYVGVYSVGSKKTRWTTSTICNDNSPAWSPDGKQFAFIRLVGMPNGDEENYRTGKKFSIWVADAASMNEKMIWQSPADDGGYAQETTRPLAWTNTNRLLFYSEQTGWNHIFSMKPDGSDVKDITPGDGEVEEYCIDATGQSIYFTTNRDDNNRRHIWKTSIVYGNPKAVTTGEGIETNPQMSGIDLYCFRSTFNSPRLLVRVDEIRKITLPVNIHKSATFSNSYFVKPEKVNIPAADGSSLSGQLFIDRTITGKRAGIIYVHGGPHRQMLPGFHHQEYYNYIYGFNQYLASMGYAVLVVNYHDGIGYGKQFRISDSNASRIEMENKDVISAAKFLQLIPEVDRAKIGLYGSAYGGYLTAIGLARNPELFKAGADLRCLNDWTFEQNDLDNGWSVTEVGVDLASQADQLVKWKAPVLFAYGSDSTSIEVQQTIDLAKKRRARKQPVELFRLPTDIHFMLRYDDWNKVLNATKDFFDKKLK